MKKLLFTLFFLTSQAHAAAVIWGPNNTAQVIPPQLCFSTGFCLDGVATVAQTITNGVTTSAPSQNVVYDALLLKADSVDTKVAKKELITLSAGDITNQYFDLSFVAEADSTDVTIDGAGMYEGALEDYTVTNVGPITRINFVGRLATGGASELIAGDKVQVRYVRVVTVAPPSSFTASDLTTKLNSLIGNFNDLLIQLDADPGVAGSNYSSSHSETGL